MAKKSDIILNDYQVEVEGELKVDNISSKAENNAVSINSPLELKDGLKVDNISAKTANEPVKINSGLFLDTVFRITSRNERLLTFDWGGMNLYLGDKSTFYFNRAGVLEIKEFGEIRAKRIKLTEAAYIKDIESSQITLGGTAKGEDAKNGKITLKNAEGKIVLTIEAEGDTTKINVPGFGDIIEKLTELQTQVNNLDSIRR